MLRYGRGDAGNGFNVTAMAYKASWNSSDQITQRAIDAGLIRSRFDAIDPTDGGAAHRYSLSGAWRRSDVQSSTEANAYLIDNQLALFSNFTYVLDNPVDGDQFAQPDRRRTAGSTCAIPGSRWARERIRTRLACGRRATTSSTACSAPELGRPLA